MLMLNRHLLKNLNMLEICKEIYLLQKIFVQELNSELNQELNSCSIPCDFPKLL